jgi:hypothetical protein
MTARMKTKAAAPAEKPEPTNAERAEVRDYMVRVKARGRRPLRFTAERRPGKPVRLDQTHVHPDVALFWMMNTLGTTSVDLADRLVSQILNATHLQPSSEPISESTLNAALGAVAGIAPRDEAEAMLAAQMVGVHWIAMDLLSQVGATGNRLLFNDAGNMVVKLLRTSMVLIEPLKLYRLAGEQRVVVQHVNVTADQATVQVNPMPNPRGKGDGMKLEDQSHGQQLGHTPEPAMRCPEPARDPVSATGCARAEAMSDARRR